MEKKESMAMKINKLNEAPTLPRMFWEGVKQMSDSIIIRQKDYGIWQEQTWNDLGECVEEIGLGLISLGLKTGEVTSILSNTNQEWVWADLAVLSSGGISNGIYPTDSPEQVEYLLSDSNSRFVFVEDEEQLDKILEIRSRLTNLIKIIVLDPEGLRDFSDPDVISLKTLREKGKNYGPNGKLLFQKRITARGPKDLAILVYTSGTTGKPKGAMISHKNITSAVKAYQAVLTQDNTDEKMLYLPLCHIMERIGGEYQSVYSGAVMNFVENPETVPENIREISPTIVGAVPRIWEKFFSSVQISIKEAGWFQQWVYKIAIGVGYQIVEHQEKNKLTPIRVQLMFAFSKWLALNNVRKMLGIHRARIALTGAAPISPDLIRWYRALGIDMIEGYGQTESSGAITVNLSGAKTGTIGPAMSHVEMKLTDDNEIIAKGDCIFMGYLNKPEKTSETLRDGWLHTGDVGQMDAEGYFTILDRMKDIIITAGGKNITPSEIENELKFSPFVTDAVVIGDKRPYLVALVMIDHENVEHYAQENSIPFSNYSSLCKREEIQSLISQEIEKANKKFARVEQIKRFKLIENKLTAEDEELTPTMKLKRKYVNQKYGLLIDEMYGKKIA